MLLCCLFTQIFSSIFLGICSVVQRLVGAIRQKSFSIPSIGDIGSWLSSTPFSKKLKFSIIQESKFSPILDFGKSYCFRVGSKINSRFAQFFLLLFLYQSSCLDWKIPNPTCQFCQFKEIMGPKTEDVAFSVFNGLWMNEAANSRTRWLGFREISYTPPIRQVHAEKCH